MSDLQPPARLRALVQWQTSKVSTLGARLTADLMPLTGRGDFAILAALEEYGALSQAELGRRLGLDRNDVNGILNRLQAGGSVDRETDPTDRRRNVITLTKAGQDHLTSLQQYADAVQSDLLGALDAGEQRQLRALLAKLLSNSGPQPA